MKIRIKNISLVFTFCILGSAQLHAAPQDEGSWSPLADWPLIAIHAVLTPQGKVLTFGTDETGAQGAHFSYDVWSPDQGMGGNSHNTLPNTLGVDSFCSAAILIPETGNVLMAGGDDRPNGRTNRGVNDAPIFNPQSNSLGRVADMASARWYPTSTVLPSGEILLTSGINNSGGWASTPEVYSPSTNTWRSLFGARVTGYYPRQWVAPNGLIFGYETDKDMFYLNPNGNGSREELGKIDLGGNPYDATAVMYQPGKILSVGGTGDSTRDVKVIDINGHTPSTRAVERVTGARAWVNSVVLPNGKVMVVGGSRHANAISFVPKEPEIWDPSTEKWSLMAPSDTPRLYHSTALLLKDGRVLVAGGGAPGPLVNTNAEVFSPPYLFDSSGQAASRPVITSSPDQVNYGDDITVKYNTDTWIARATFVKTGAVTHSFNMDQRFMDMGISGGSGTIKVSIPRSANIAPPGYYLMHLIDNKGVPSEAHMIHLRVPSSSNVAAFARADSASVSGSGSITINALANDDGSGLTLNAPNVWSLRGGNVALSNNKITYKSKAGYNGEDKIWYNIQDDQGRTSFSEITITISGNNATDVFPVAKADNINVSGGNSITIDALANDTGSSLTLNAPNVWSLKGGTVALSNNKLTYRPKAGFSGEDKIWYSIQDNQGRSSFSVITINVTNNNALVAIYPAGSLDIVSVVSGAAKTFNVLANDAGSGLTLNAPSAWSLKGGTVSLANNNLVYRSKAGFTGSDNIWYTFTDSQGRSAFGQVNITVTR